MLFVDDNQAEILEFYVRPKQLVRADHDVDRAIAHGRQDSCGLLGGAKARQALDLDGPVGEAVSEILVVLLRQQGRRHQDGHLPGAVHRHEGGAHGDLGLAEADVSTHQPVHRFGGEQICGHRVNGGLLVGCLLELECCRELLIILAGIGERHALAGGSSGIDIQQLGRDIADSRRRLALGLLPLIGPQAVQRRRFRRRAGVAADQV